MENKLLHIVKVSWVNVCRFFLAAVFIFSGFVKAVDPLGSTYKIEDYFAAFNFTPWMPSFVPLLLAIALSALEFSIGVCFLFGIRRKLTSWLALLFMGVMTPLTLYLAIKNPVSDCGCFGDAWVLSNWQTFYKNLVLLAAVIFVFSWRKQVIRFVSVKTEWLVSLYTVFFICTLSLYCLGSLPIIDFRPYRIGKNITQQMSIPPGEKPTTYDTFFTLTKNGQKKEFSLADYPDSTWTFLSARTVVKEKGYEPPIRDFALSDQEGNDLTTTVLADKGYTFLLVANKLDKADDGSFDLINQIYDYAVEHGYKFYCVTSSPSEDIEKWKDDAGAEYPFLVADDIVLKTIIRSNPGLLLLRHGTILNKWADGSLPTEYDMNGRLEDLPLGKQKDVNDARTIGKVCLWFVLPLLGIWGLDILWVRRHEWWKKKKVKDTKETNI